MTELDSTETKTEEEVLETTVNTDDNVQYEIVDGDLDGVKVRGVRANGNLLFTVSEAFTNDQIQEVFNLANKFFNDGLTFGAGQTAARYLQFHEQMKALVPKPAPADPAAPEEEASESAELDTE